MRDGRRTAGGRGVRGRAGKIVERDMNASRPSERVPVRGGRCQNV